MRLSDMAHQHSWLDRLALGMFTARIMWWFFAFINVFMALYIALQGHFGIPDFDPWPYQMLNLILGIFMAEMSVIIVIAQIVAGYRTDEQTSRLVELSTESERNTDLLVQTTETLLILMQSLEAMGLRETERDAELHQIIKEGHARGVILERLLRECIEKGDI